MSADFINGGLLSSVGFTKACFELISKMIEHQFILACVIAAAIGCLLSNRSTEAMPSSAFAFLNTNGMTRKPPRKPPDKTKTMHSILWLIALFIATLANGHHHQYLFVDSIAENNELKPSFCTQNNFEPPKLNTPSFYQAASPGDWSPRPHAIELSSSELSCVSASKASRNN